MRALISLTAFVAGITISSISKINISDMQSGWAHETDLK